METRRKFLHPRRDLSREADRERWRENVEAQGDGRTDRGVHVPALHQSWDGEKKRVHGEMKDDETIRTRSDVDGGLSPRTSLRKRSKVKGPDEGEAIDNVIFKTFIISAQ